VEDVVFLGYPDGRLLVTVELRRDISRVIRQKRPQRMLIQSPERNWERIYSRTRTTSRPARRRSARSTPTRATPSRTSTWPRGPRGLDGRRGVGDGRHHAGPNRYVDVTDTFERKHAALLQHVSQTSHMEDLEGMLRGWLAHARGAGFGEGRLAEAFRVVPDR
jgi:LmbE family N-acetylglucosaminyl deacetylase